MDIMYIRRAMGGFYLYLCCVIAMTIFGRRYHILYIIILYIISLLDMGPTLKTAFSLLYYAVQSVCSENNFLN